MNSAVDIGLETFPVSNGAGTRRRKIFASVISCNGL